MTWRDTPANGHPTLRRLTQEGRDAGRGAAHEETIQHGEGKQLRGSTLGVALLSFQGKQFTDTPTLWTSPIPKHCTWTAQRAFGRWLKWRRRTNHCYPGNVSSCDLQVAAEVSVGISPTSRVGD